MSDNRALRGTIINLHEYPFGPTLYFIRPDEGPYQTVFALWSAHPAIVRPTLGGRVLYRMADSPLIPRWVLIWELFWDVGPN